MRFSLCVAVTVWAMTNAQAQSMPQAVKDGLNRASQYHLSSDSLYKLYEDFTPDGSPSGKGKLVRFEVTVAAAGGLNCSLRTNRQTSPNLSSSIVVSGLSLSEMKEVGQFIRFR